MWSTVWVRDMEDSVLWYLEGGCLKLVGGCDERECCLVVPDVRDEPDYNIAVC